MEKKTRNCSAPVHRIRKNLCKSFGFCSCNGRLLLEPYRNILPSSCKAWLARLFLHGSEQLQIDKKIQAFCRVAKSLHLMLLFLFFGRFFCGFFCGFFFVFFFIFFSGAVPFRVGHGYCDFFFGMLCNIYISENKESCARYHKEE